MDVRTRTSEQEQVLVGRLIDVLPTGLSVDECDFCKMSEATYQPRYLDRKLTIKVIPSTALAKTTLLALLSALESEYIRPFLVGHLKKGTLDLTMLKDVLKRVMMGIRTRGPFELYECPLCTCQSFRDRDAYATEFMVDLSVSKWGYNGVQGCAKQIAMSRWVMVCPDWKNLE